MNCEYARISVNSELFKTALSRTKSKYKDLKGMCDTGVIPKIFYSE